MKLKRTLLVFLLLCLTLGAMLLIVSAADIVASGECGENLTWTLDSEGTLTISGEGEMYDFEYEDESGTVFYATPYQDYHFNKVIIEPGVTSIGVYAFGHSISLKNIVIPDSVVSIGEYAFSSCSGLTTIELPDSITTIDNSAFSHCSSLANVEFPNSLVILGDDAFSGCSSLTEVELPTGLSSIRKNAFYYCSSLTKVMLSDGLTSIGDSAFYNCSSLASVTLPKSLTRIDQYAFAACSSLVKVELPDNLTSIGNGVFESCSSLTSIELPDSLSSINDNVFSGCRSLVNVELPDNITTIGNSAFSYCSSLTGVVFPESLITIGTYAFFNCSSLTSVELPSSLSIIGECTFAKCSSLINVELPDGLTSISDGLFDSCSSLTDMKFPDELTSIGRLAFSNCSSLADVGLPDSLSSIGEETFADCNSLSSVEFPDAIISIGKYAFYNCIDLHTISFKGDAPSIAEKAFYEVTATAYYPAGNDTWTEEVMQDYGGDITWKAAKPLAIKTQPKTGYAKMGETVKVTVKAEGDGLKYQWYIKNANGTKYSKSSVTSATYSTTMNDKSKGRRVYCVITDAYGNKVQSKTVILREAVSVTTEPKNTYVKSGSTAKVSLKASGDGLTYQWYIKNAGQTKYSKSSVTSATYSCKMNDKSKDRLVYCVVTDQYGKTVKSKTVILRMAATVTTQPKSVTVAEGKTAKVSFQAVGDGLTYQWYIKNEGGTKFSKSSVTSATYSCKMSEKADGRQVYCVVTDKYGKTAQTNTVTLSMK